MEGGKAYEAIEVDAAPLTVKLVDSYKHPSGFMLSLLELKRGDETWHVLRRYTWFRALNEMIDSPETFPSGWFFVSEESQVQAQHATMQVFLDLWAKPPHVHQPAVQSFFTPLRRLRLINEATGLLQLMSNKVAFIDPLFEGDVYCPLWGGQAVEPLAHPLVLKDMASPSNVWIPARAILTTQEQEEQIEVRKAISIIENKVNYRQAANPLNPLLLGGYKARLRELVLPIIDK